MVHEKINGKFTPLPLHPDAGADDICSATA
jgi:hypothetical protein